MIGFQQFGLGSKDAIAYVTIPTSKVYPLRDDPCYQRQREPIIRFADRVRLRFCRTISENLVEKAGGVAFNRKGMLKLLSIVGQDAEWWGNKFHPTVVLIHNQNDLALSNLELAALLTSFKERKILLFEVEAIENEIELTSDPPFDLESLKSSLGFRSVRQQLTAALQNATRIRSGRKPGPPPFGKLPDERETLVEMWRLRRKPPKGRQRNYREIAKALNASGQPSRSLKPWTASMVREILKDGRPRWLNSPVSDD